MTTSPQEGAIGVPIIVTIVNATGQAVDLSQAVTKNLIFKKADGTTQTVAADFYTNGTDGKLVYTTENDTDLVHGSMKVQPEIEITDVYQGKLSVGSFEVYKNLS